MQINWFTVIAQILNFLVLVWLLKRYLYKPILKAIDDREKKIAAELKNADTKKAEAKKEQDEFKQKNDDFDKQKTDLVNKAIADANNERQKLIEAAKTDATALKAKLDAATKEELENMKGEIAKKTQEEVFAIARKALTDIASVSMEEQSVHLFIKCFNELKEEEKKKFIDSFHSKSAPVVIRTAFDLPANLHDEIKKAVNALVGTEAQFEFKTAPELISGIELTANGYKLAWTISEYLNSMQKSLSDILKIKPEDEKKAAPEVK